MSTPPSAFFWVPPEARWQNLQNQAARPEIATLIDDAILAVERDNPNLKNKLPRERLDSALHPPPGGAQWPRRRRGGFCHG